MELALSEVKARGAHTTVISDCLHLLNTKNINFSIGIRNCGALTALVSVVPFQILANEIAVSKGLNPDQPRNLAKTVTVG